MIDVPRETESRLALLRELVLAEADRQNLIAASTAEDIDTRHIADSLQLFPYIPRGVLVDIGTGAGFPGLVLGCARTDPTHLVEPRAMRADFLRRAVDALGIADRVTVWQCKIERADIMAAQAITARAVASIDRLFSIAAPIASEATRWVLPKGRNAQSELDTARQSWQGAFELVPSATDPKSWIVLADTVSRRRKA